MADAPVDGLATRGADPGSEALARLAAEACDDRKAVDIRLIRVEDVSSLADWFVICSGLSDVQVRAIARSVEDRLAVEVQRLPLRREGQREGRWLLLDYGEVIVHVLTPQERHFYDLEAFWRHGEQHRFTPTGPLSSGASATPAASLPPSASVPPATMAPIPHSPVSGA